MELDLYLNVWKKLRGASLCEMESEKLTGLLLAVLPTDVVNAADGRPVADCAVRSSRVVVVEPVWQRLVALPCDSTEWVRGGMCWAYHRMMCPSSSPTVEQGVFGAPEWPVSKTWSVGDLRVVGAAPGG
jgi:hypothetical protein